MTLKFKKPTVQRGRLKVLLFGNAGVGKTYTAINFPKPCVIDTEDGMKYQQYIDILTKDEGALLNTRNFDEIYEQTHDLLTQKHPFKTLIIDSLSNIYNDLLLEEANRLAEIDKQNGKITDGTDYGRHYIRADNKIKRLLFITDRLDMNVILTAHSKNKKNTKGEIIGTTFDCYKKLNHHLDLLLELRAFGKDRKAFISKSRIPEFPQDQLIDPFDYEIFANLYGIELINKEVTQSKLATSEQVKQLKDLVLRLEIPETTYSKWLTKHKSNQFEDLEEHIIQKYINKLKELIEEKKKQLQHSMGIQYQPPTT